MTKELACTLMLNCKTEKGWRRYPASFGKNGRIRPNHADVNGQQVQFDQARYELRYYADRKVVYKSVGKDAQQAVTARSRHESMQVARDSAKAAGTSVLEKEHVRKKLIEERQRWLDRLEGRGKIRAVETHRVSIDDFLSITEHRYADQITEDSMLRFYKMLRKRGNSDRTLYNKSMDLSGWFKWMGLEVKVILPDKPKYTEREVEVYHQETLGVFFKACKPGYQTVLFQTLLKTGLREQEAMHLDWTNVDFKSKTLKVRENWKTKSTIKDRGERSVPLADDLLELLKGWRAERPKAHLVFGTRADKPNNHMLYTLKAVAKKAGLNCNRCEGCSGTGLCYRWYLHKFRATYTTRLLQAGVDARTVMAYTGHADLATVLRYLAPAEDAPMQAKISGIQWVK